MTYPCTEYLFALRIPRYSTLVSCFASYICNLQVNETNSVDNPLKMRIWDANNQSWSRNLFILAYENFNHDSLQPIRRSSSHYNL